MRSGQQMDGDFFLSGKLTAADRTCPWLCGLRLQTKQAHLHDGGLIDRRASVVYIGYNLLYIFAVYINNQHTV